MTAYLPAALSYLKLIEDLCRDHDVSLFTLDEHFSSVPGLKLFQE
jgi:hypothetical protein